MSMDEQNEAPERPRYKWPWYVLGAVFLGVVLTVVWMTVLIRRIHEERENAWPPTTQMAPSQTNLPALKSNPPPPRPGP